MAAQGSPYPYPARLALNNQQDATVHFFFEPGGAPLVLVALTAFAAVLATGVLAWCRAGGNNRIAASPCTLTGLVLFSQVSALKEVLWNGFCSHNGRRGGGEEGKWNGMEWNEWMEWNGMEGMEGMEWITPPARPPEQVTDPGWKWNTKYHAPE